MNRWGWRCCPGANDDNWASISRVTVTVGPAWMRLALSAAYTKCRPVGVYSCVMDQSLSIVIRDPRISCAAIVALLALVLNSLALCGEIHDAVRIGDLEKVKALLRNSPDLVFYL